MATTGDIITHMDNIATAAAAAVDSAIAAEPGRFLKNELGRALVDEMHKAIELAAASENFSDLDDDLVEE